MRLIKLGELDGARLKTPLKINAPLLGILLGFILVSVGTGQFTNYDTQLEFKATLGVIWWGLPWIAYGSIINQPPLGFYVNSLFLRVTGLSSYDLTYATGVASATVFGLGCVFLVYKIGEGLYGRRTGLLASGLFALMPWQVVLSRSFLIDVQCLFFSLLYLFIGILAIQKRSARLFLLSGILFGTAVLVKVFAVFMLIPLVLFFIFSRPKNFTKIGWAGFFIPAFLIVFTWYGVISGRGFTSAFMHDDFTNYNPIDAIPSIAFAANFLVNALGVFFIAASAVSLAVSFSLRKTQNKFFWYDLIWLLTFAAVVGLNTYLAVGLNLVAPYNNPIKYEYQALPLLCLLVGSLAAKSFSLPNSVSAKARMGKVVFALVVLGLVFTAVSMIQNFQILTVYSGQNIVRFDVEGQVTYDFDNIFSQTPAITTAIQVAGFALILLSLVLASKRNKEQLGTLFSEKK